MIVIESSREINIRDVIKRSPVSHLPGAEEVLRECLYRSVHVRYGLVDGEVACVWGLIPPTLLSTTAYLWLLTTEIIAEHKFLFVRYSQLYVQEALKSFPCIIGDCIVGERSAMRWLRWLGAEFAEPIDGRIPFVIRKK